MPTYQPILFRDRPRPVQVLVGGLAPIVIGALAGILAGVSSAGYWIVALLAAVGALLAGFEHRDGWGGADRGMIGGLLYGLALVITHAIAGTGLKVSLGSRPVLVIATTIIGILLGALGGRLSRAQRERAAG